MKRCEAQCAERSGGRGGCDCRPPHIRAKEYQKTKATKTKMVNLAEFTGRARPTRETTREAKGERGAEP